MIFFYDLPLRKQTPSFPFALLISIKVLSLVQQMTVLEWDETNKTPEVESQSIWKIDDPNSRIRVTLTVSF